jgi:hypothetical protein
VGWLINCPYHVLLCGRQTGQYEDDEDGRLRAVGVKMRSEKETPYEAHVCVRMECVYEKNKAKTNIGLGVPTAYVEKDRSGILQGNVYAWPSFATLALPLLPLLGNVQGQVDSEEDAGARDAEAIAAQDRQRESQSLRTLDELTAQFTLSKTLATVEEIAKTITPALKKSMLAEHVAQLRDAYHQARLRLRGNGSGNNGGSGTADAGLVNQLRASIEAKAKGRAS